MLIPKSLVSDVSSIKVYVNESEVTFNSASKADAWELFFTYPHSTHQVVVNLDAPLPPPDSSFFETPLGMALIVGGIVAAAVVVAFVVVRKRRK